MSLVLTTVILALTPDCIWVPHDQEEFSLVPFLFQITEQAQGPDLDH